MKTTPHLLLTAALALGTSFATAQEEAKPQPPPPPETPARPPAAARPNQPRPLERERMRDDKEKERREQRGERPGERQDGPRGERDRRDDRDRRDGPDKPGEMQRSPGSGHGPEQQRRMPMPPPAPAKPTSYIGVVTTPPPAVISAQFGLAPGFGLVVAEVLPDSPAATAGLQKHDVLTKFNDQQLVDGGQFSTLVRAQAKDSEATLTLFRKAQEQKVTIKIGEKMMPERRPFPMGHMLPDVEKLQGPAMEHMKKLQERAKDYGHKMREFQERMKEWQRKPTAEMPEAPKFEGGDDLRLNTLDILREVQPGGAPVVTLLQPESAISYHTRDAKLLMKDDSGEIELSNKDGQRQLVARNPQGETIFEGPIDTEEQRAALPEELRKKVELINTQTKIVRFDAPAFVPTEFEGDVQ